jgi:hypothetical protein
VLTLNIVASVFNKKAALKEEKSNRSAGWIRLHPNKHWCPNIEQPRMVEINQR